MASQLRTAPEWWYDNSSDIIVCWKLELVLGYVDVVHCGNINAVSNGRHTDMVKEIREMIKCVGYGRLKKDTGDD